MKQMNLLMCIRGNIELKLLDVSEMDETAKTLK